MAKAGLSYPVLAKVHERLSTREVVALLAGAGQKSARVTNSADIPARIVFSLKKGLLFPIISLLFLTSFQLWPTFCLGSASLYTEL